MRFDFKDTYVLVTVSSSTMATAAEQEQGAPWRRTTEVFVCISVVPPNIKVHYESNWCHVGIKNVFWWLSEYSQVSYFEKGPLCRL